MNLKYKPLDRIKLDTARKKAIEKYLELQEVYQKLYNMCLVQKFTLYREQEEIDIDKLTEDQIKKMDKASKSEREALMKKYPTCIQEYDTYLIAPYYIWDSKQRQDICIDALDTEIIKLINERVEIEIKDYKQFIK